MQRPTSRLLRAALITAAAATTALIAGASSAPVGAQSTGPTLVDPDLGVRTAAGGLVTPSAMAFIGPNEFLVVEKNTGAVKRVVGGEVQSTVLDLSVNNASERGLLGIALHPRFPKDPGVYLYWTCRSTTPLDGDPFRPEEEECSDAAMTGQPDTGVTLEVPLLGTRVDRFEWTGSQLVYDHNLTKLLAFQHDGAPEPEGQGDSAQPARGNHDGGPIAFGPDRKLYIAVGDLGRRGWMQNLLRGPTPPTDDDQFGGPESDDAHLSGVILRLDDDGSTPRDNPFFKVGDLIGGEAGDNIQRVFAYGLRNSFGIAFDPRSGNLWDQQNADDAFDEINRVERGMNGGWIQVMGPLSRIRQFKEIEQTLPPSGGLPGAQLQQIRWPPSNIADNPFQAFFRLFWLPGSRYSDPEFSWKFAVPPAGIGFLSSRELGREYRDDLFAGAATENTAGGYLFRFDLSGNRRSIDVDDRRLEDRVADNTAKHDITESESLLFGSNFGVGTDIETGPNGNLFVVSLSHGVVYEIFRR
jgi:glucose/arabinose dehydrogenase